MNLNQNPTVEELRSLLVSADDWAGHHVLWVNPAGDVILTRLPKGWPPEELTAPEVRIRCETFLLSYGYVGPEVAGNAPWLAGLLRVLLWAWDKSAAGAHPFLIELEEVLYPNRSRSAVCLSS